MKTKKLNLHNKRRQTNRKINLGYEQAFLEEKWRMANKSERTLTVIIREFNEIPFFVHQTCRHKKKTLNRPHEKVGTPPVGKILNLDNFLKSTKFKRHTL